MTKWFRNMMQTEKSEEATAHTQPITRNKELTRRLIFVGGLISLVFGIVGIAIPILPTTPFLLLASGAFAKSSKRFNDWLLNNKILGMYIRNYREGKGMPLKIKIITLTLLWVTILISIFMLMNLLWIQVILLIIAITVSGHIILIRPKKKVDNEELRENNVKRI